MPAHVRIVTRQYCGYCTAAIDLLDKKGVAYDHVDATGNDKLRTEVARESGRSTMPQIFINGKPVGGYDDLKALDRRGELDKLLAAES
ncbi:MAG TPA: glutaredoxin 3 [Kofleriaceae bacterium]|jgi:glutaredoxin 3